MPVRIEQTVTTEYDGSSTRKNFVTAKCDGPNCQKADAPCKSIMAWEEAQDEAQLQKLPDEVFRLLVLSHLNGTKAVFFSRNCLKEFMRNYVPPKTPREVADAVKAAAEAASKKAAVQDGGDEIAKTIGGIPEVEGIPTASAAGAGE